MRTVGTKDKVLSEGRALLQRHGYNGFSFQDIANRLNIKKPSLYDHYSSKEQLIVAILENYSYKFDEWAKANTEHPPLERIRRVFDVFYAFAADKRKVCPVLSLAADFQGLAREIQKEMVAFVEKWLGWLELQIEEGQRTGVVRKDFAARDLAQFIYSQGMGSQFQARITDAPELTRQSGDQIVRFLKV